MPLYPFMFVLPERQAVRRRARRDDAHARPRHGPVDDVGTSPIDGQSAVMYRPGKILKSGTWSDPEFPGRAVTNRAAAIDMTAARPGLARGRAR